MATYTIEFGQLGDSRPVPPITVRTTDPNVLARTVVAHARPHITPVLAAMGRPELADCLFRTTADRTGGELLHLDLARAVGTRVLGARIATTPERVQRRRTKGSTLGGARYVGRGTRWGNPFRVVHGPAGWNVRHDVSLAEVGLFPNEVEARRYAAQGYEIAHLKSHPELAEAARAELAGRDLACWCPLPEDGEPDHCHAAVLLRVAAGGES